ncbi:hypothetical protein [Paraburkholderia humisilvae]|uniref:Uncharacterized protein n=1 Tax=Paraburkholderia humisilvae TaxID=627669 RepID=A0A6J5DW58_9BURK|nr:hypothetical protein [Paraburkholderia humisilvae]CAB3758520.1 hypothetical protein LMG29542_03363 [Paraburkholderia humisilvae]
MTHRCLWPGCERNVSASMWGCRTHWFALPARLRSRIGHAYRDGVDVGEHPTRRWREAHADALAWIAQHEEELHGRY